MIIFGFGAVFGVTLAASAVSRRALDVAVGDGDAVLDPDTGAAAPVFVKLTQQIHTRFTNLPAGEEGFENVVSFGVPTFGTTFGETGFDSLAPFESINFSLTSSALGLLLKKLNRPPFEETIDGDAGGDGACGFASEAGLGFEVIDGPLVVAVALAAIGGDAFGGDGAAIGGDAFGGVGGAKAIFGALGGSTGTLGDEERATGALGGGEAATTVAFDSSTPNEGSLTAALTLSNASCARPTNISRVERKGRWVGSLNASAVVPFRDRVSHRGKGDPIAARRPASPPRPRVLPSAPIT